MSWIGLLLVGIGLTDLVFSARPRAVVPQVVAAVLVVGLGLLAGLTGPADLVALPVIAALVLLWGFAVTRGFGRGPAWLPLALLGTALLAGLLLAGVAGEAGGPLGDWLADSPVPHLGDLEPDRALLLLGVLLVQLSTGNVVVRLVLSATGTLNPLRARSEAAPASLKGGRLLGPMERVFIVGLGLAGEITAASIVIAAKGLLRFPELQAARDADRDDRSGPSARGPGIHEVTEYFLLGSFVSWLVALGSLVLLSG